MTTSTVRLSPRAEPSESVSPRAETSEWGGRAVKFMRSHLADPVRAESFRGLDASDAFVSVKHPGEVPSWVEAVKRTGERQGVDVAGIDWDSVVLVNVNFGDGGLPYFVVVFDAASAERLALVQMN